MSADDVETVALEWMSPHEALAAVSTGVIAMAPPQWYIVHELAEKCPSLKDARAYASSPERTLRREYPIKPYVIDLSPSERSQLLATKHADAIQHHSNAEWDDSPVDKPVFTSAYASTMASTKDDAAVGVPLSYD